MLRDLFIEHVRIREKRTWEALESLKYPTLLIDAGEKTEYFADDQSVLFRPTPHFAAWTPLKGPGHALLIAPGQKTKCLRFEPADFWHDPHPENAEFCLEPFEVVSFKTEAAFWEYLRGLRISAYHGPREAKARTELPFGDINPKRLVANLNWNRSAKTPYEIECLKLATKNAVLPHTRARDAFYAGASELDIHYAFVNAAGCAERDLPYGVIVGLDENSAILHYESKRTRNNGLNFLIDAGLSVHGYCCDVSRTYIAHDRALIPPEWISLLRGLEKLQAELCAMVKAGVHFLSIHQECCAKIAALLLETKVIQNISVEAALANKLVRKFFPHGVGHMLGIQVHDVGGSQIDPMGTPAKSMRDETKDDPLPRAPRPIYENEIITIEPGIYFIASILEELKTSEEAKHVNWPLVEKLRPLGGMRIEDDVQVKIDGSLNITRLYL